MWVQVELNINKQISYTTKTESFLDEIYLYFCPTKFVVNIVAADFTRQIVHSLASHGFLTRIFRRVK